jgi:hypothetical protein
MTNFNIWLFMGKIRLAFRESLENRGVECVDEIDADSLSEIVEMCADNAAHLVDQTVRRSECPISFDPEPADLDQLIDESQQICTEVQAAIDHNDPEAELVALRDLFRIVLEIGRVR